MPTKVPNTTMDGVSVHDTRVCDCGVCDGKRRQLWSTVEAFVTKQKISCPETIWQSDRVIENGYDFIRNCADITGYYQYPDED